MATDVDPYRLSSPRIFLVRVVLFLILVGFVALFLYRQIAIAFMANPGLNGLIFGVLAIGIIMGLRQIGRLFREVRWVNALPGGVSGRVKSPILLAPMATLIGDKPVGTPISTLTLRAILDSIGTRLDEARETARYLTGLLIFLGLLGTFWGLLETVGSIGGVIKSMQTGADSTAMFDDLKNGLSAPIAGMSVSFTSSLFGLAGSLVLGFLDLQAGQAQNRFYNELEDNLTALTTEAALPAPADVTAAAPDGRAALQTLGDGPQTRATSAAIANLAEGVQSLVQHMRAEQQLIRNWVEGQAEQGREIKALLQRLSADKTEVP